MSCDMLLTHWGPDKMAAVFQTTFLIDFLEWNFIEVCPKGPINNIPLFVQIMAWRRPDDKPLSEPMLVSLLMYICITRPQWVKMNSNASHIRPVGHLCGEFSVFFVYYGLKRSIDVRRGWTIYFPVPPLHVVVGTLQGATLIMLCKKAPKLCRFAQVLLRFHGFLDGVWCVIGKLFCNFNLEGNSKPRIYEKICGILRRRVPESHLNIREDISFLYTYHNCIVCNSSCYFQGCFADFVAYVISMKWLQLVYWIYYCILIICLCYSITVCTVLYSYLPMDIIFSS